MPLTRMRHRLFQRLCSLTLACGLGLGLSGMSAQACSYDGMALDLSLAHPASLGVALAAQQAYQDKLMPRPLPLPGGFGMRRTLGMLEKLQQRLPTGSPSFSLLLVEPGLWSNFTADGVRLHADPDAGERLVILSEGALLALEGGRLPAAKAMQSGLLVIDGPDADALAKLWLSAYPG
ncbi:hypothetical protein [Aquipseudomonas alcaligenes]|uniref:hypothetical protein n=1 Tax=Aquipseudomonas alcaligenes TaxID=43263 RepID=UPI003749FB65